MVNACESPINVVILARLKRLTSLNQNGTWSGWSAANSLHADDAPSAERWHLRPSRDMCAERGKPVFFLPFGSRKATRKGSR